MQNQILLIARYGAAILFVVLEIICFYLIVNYNQTQKGIYINSTKLFSAYLNRESTEIGDFLKLKDINDSLRIENAHLMQRIINAPELTLTVDPKIDADSSLINYFIIPSAICNKTLHLRNNHITLCKGSDDAITKDMGVVTTDGLVGIIKNTSPHFSQVMSLLNSDVRVSAQIGSTGFHGNLVWKGTNTSILNLEAIPKHADIQVGRYNFDQWLLYYFSKRSPYWHY